MKKKEIKITTIIAIILLIIIGTWIFWKGQETKTKQMQLHSKAGTFYASQNITGTILNDSGIDVTDRVKAIVETAWSYYWKGTSIQYDNSSFYRVKGKYQNSKQSFFRGDYDVSPEQATDQHTLYFVCSSFCYNVYHEAIGYDVLGNGKSCNTGNLAQTEGAYYDALRQDGILVYQYQPSLHTTDGDIASKKANFSGHLKVGDIVNYHDGNKGHAMLYIGEVNGKKMFAHSIGENYNWSQKKDVYENYSGNTVSHEEMGLETTGTVNMVSLDKRLDSIFNPANISVRIIRPVNAIKNQATDYQVTNNGQARVQYPGLEINKTASVQPNITVNPGDIITIRTKVTNHSEKSYSVTYQDTIPDGTTYVANSLQNANITGNQISGNILLAAGQSKTVSYQIKVNSNARDGQVIRK